MRRLTRRIGRRIRTWLIPAGLEQLGVAAQSRPFGWQLCVGAGNDR
jgi:hypothetical protein